MNTLYYHSQSSPRVTVACILVGKQARFGVARCSKNDQFQKKTGRFLAETRALSRPCLTTTAPRKIGKWFLDTAKGLAEIVKMNPELTTVGKS